MATYGFVVAQAELGLESLVDEGEAIVPVQHRDHRRRGLGDRGQHGLAALQIARRLHL